LLVDFVGRLAFGIVEDQLGFVVCFIADTASVFLCSFPASKPLHTQLIISHISLRIILDLEIRHLSVHLAPRRLFLILPRLQSLRQNIIIRRSKQWRVYWSSRRLLFRRRLFMRFFQRR
jgi:hypothetical protein